MEIKEILNHDVTWGILIVASLYALYLLKHRRTYRQVSRDLEAMIIHLVHQWPDLSYTKRHALQKECVKTLRLMRRERTADIIFHEQKRKLKASELTDELIERVYKMINKKDLQYEEDVKYIQQSYNDCHFYLHPEWRLSITVNENIMTF